MKRGADASCTGGQSEKFQEEHETGISFAETSSNLQVIKKFRQKAAGGAVAASNYAQSKTNNFDAPRNIHRGHLVYTSAAREAAQARQSIQRKTPRWQPRGDDTQSFRPLVQEERGVLRVRLLAHSTRVNTLFSLRQLEPRLTRI